MDRISMRTYTNKRETSIFLARYDMKIISLGDFLVKILLLDIIIIFIHTKLIEEPPKDNKEDSEYLGYVFKVTHLRIQYFYSNSWLGYLPVFIFAQNIIPQNLSIILLCPRDYSSYDDKG